MLLPRFIDHLDGIVLRVFKQKRSAGLTVSLKRLDTLSEKLTEMNQLQCAERRAKRRAEQPSSICTSALSVIQKLSVPSFISHPNGIVLRVFKQKQSTTKQSIVPRHVIAHKPSGTVSLKDLNHNFENNVDSHPNGSVLRVLKQDLEEMETVTDQQLVNAKQRSAQRLPSFIGHQTGIVLCVLKRQQSMIQKDQRRVYAKQRSPSSSVPSFICHPNGMVLRVLNQQRFQLQSPSDADLSKYVLIQKRSLIKSNGIALQALEQK